MRRILLLLLLLCCQSTFALEIPQASGFVNDHAGMLSSSENAELEKFLRAIEQKSTVEIAILTLPSLEGENLELLANDIFRQWGIGKKDVNNGVLILVIQDEQSIRIEVGTGLEGVLTDVTSGMIIRNRMAPAFKQGNYAGGLAAASQDIWQIAEGDIATQSKYSMSYGGGKSYEFVTVFILIATYMLVVGFSALMFKDDKKKKRKIQSGTFYTILIIAWVLSTILGSVILWFTLFFLIMFGTIGGGWFFVPLYGGRGGGGFSGGGFGGFSGGFSGGGGASGGW